eukprot:3213058-Amphidinium_carterae.2
MLLHATKPSSEAHSIIRRVMRQSNGFESWRQLQLHFAGGDRAQHFTLLRTIMQPSWNSATTPDDEDQSGYYIRRGTSVDFQLLQQHLHWDNKDNKGQVGGVNNYDDENYDNEENYEEEYDESWDYDNNDKVTVAFMKGKAKGQRNGKGKCKKGDNGKGKDGKTTASMEKDRTKGYPQQQPPYQQHYYSQPTQYPSPPPQQYNKGYSKGYGTQWNKGGKKGQVPIQQINDNDYTYYYDEDPHSWDYSYNQEWLPLPGQEADQQQILQQPYKYNQGIREPPT